MNSVIAFIYLLIFKQNCFFTCTIRKKFLENPHLFEKIMKKVESHLQECDKIRNYISRRDWRTSDEETSDWEDLQATNALSRGRRGMYLSYTPTGFVQGFKSRGKSL